MSLIFFYKKIMTILMMNLDKMFIFNSSAAQRPNSAADSFHSIRCKRWWRYLSLWYIGRYVDGHIDFIIILGVLCWWWILSILWGWIQRIPIYILIFKNPHVGEKFTRWQGWPMIASSGCGWSARMEETVVFIRFTITIIVIDCCYCYCVVGGGEWRKL